MSTRTPPNWLKPVTEYGPLAAFMLAYFQGDLLIATAVLMVTTAIGLALSWWYLRKLPMMPVVTAAVVGVFGGLTLWLQDETFIKMKPTIIQALFAVLLLGGLALNRVFLKPLLGSALPMQDEGWRKLTLRFGLFFAAMAVLNEVVWRTQSTDFWVTFKVFGLMALTFAFLLSQAPLINRYRIDQEGEAGDA
ncbi:septation protein A [Telmatospirillum sp. J64-1]|uniref:septation protein A n=1 Tax=Telmatospirillum sp. J64-1 TaxID=2502183 RepID=UPI00115F7390|nr:septation protein A [Telmatospirillum sp. J64-1]